MHTSQVHKHARKTNDIQGGQQDAFPECLPIVVGVTGHRDYDPQYTEQLKAAITRILNGVLDNYRNTEIILLSPLAPGADRLAADVALNLGISLYVPLPFPKDSLPPGFVESKEHAHFEKLCRDAKHLFFAGQPLETARPFAPSKHSAKGSDLETEAQYAAAGAFVAAHCHILIALWDGKKDSQTAHTLDYKRIGLPQKFAPGRSLLDTVDGGLWHHVYTPRKDAGPSGTVPPLVPGQDLPHTRSDEKTDLAMYQNIDEYNGYVRNLLRRFVSQAPLRASRNALMPDNDQIKLSPALERLRHAFAAADVLAIEFKQKAHRNFAVLAFLVIAATATSLAQSDFPFFRIQEKPSLLFLAAFLLILVQALRKMWNGTRYRYQDKFQDYRALAEGLRVQFYWTLLGLPDSVAEHYLRKQRSELEWIRRVFSIWNIYKGGDEETYSSAIATQRTPRITVVLKCWVEEQQDFFKRKHIQNEVGSQRAEFRETRLLMLYIGLMAFFGLLLSLAHGSWPFSSELERSFAHLPLLVRMPEAQIYEFLHGPSILLIELPLIVAAVLHLRAEKFALAAQAKQYERMDRLFTHAKGATGAVPTGGDARMDER